MRVSPPPAHPVLIINPRSGGGKAERFGLARECRARGIEPLVFQPGDDLRAIATAAVAAGADVIGVAGGDGSQAVVAEIASAHDIPYVCIPAGTRNHFANDLGVDRRDVVGALDAFSHGCERRIDLARVNGRVFVNNASLGVYAKIVQSERYRDAKVETAAQQLPGLLSPHGEPFALRFTAPDGTHWDSAHLVLVSNNPYKPPPPTTHDTRGDRQRAPRRDRHTRPHPAATRQDQGDRDDRRSAEISRIAQLHDTDIHCRLDRPGGCRARRRSARDRAAAAVRVPPVGVAGASDAAGAGAAFASTNTTVPATNSRYLGHFSAGQKTHARRT